MAFRRCDRSDMNRNGLDYPELPMHGLCRRQFLSLGATAVAAHAVGAGGAAVGAKRLVVVWSEGTAPKEMYPGDINTAVAEGLKPLAGWEIRLAGLDQAGQGLPEDLLKMSDVLIWWGHKRHREVKDDLVDRIELRVKEGGMGFIALHSAHFAKPYRRLMGTACGWREYKADGTSARVVVKDATHPISKGLRDFDLPKIERYGEPFQVPEPEAVVLDGVYTKPNGQKEPGRMGLCWTVGKGRVFYFTPGHETYNDFYRPEVRLIMRNAVEWGAPRR